MLLKWLCTCVFVFGLLQVAHAQARRDVTSLEAEFPTGGAAESSGGAKWRVPAGRTSISNTETTTPEIAAPAANGQATLPGLPPASARDPIARATQLNPRDGLPNDAGQELWVYDISPYTARVTSTNRPEQAIRDWILRETGYEAWHGEVAFLCAERTKLYVYHTPQMQAVVANMVDRFVNTEAESYAFGMRVVTLASPDWRVKAHRMLHAVPSQTPGVQAWLLAKEDASLMLSELSRRSDFQEQSTPHLLVNNGQSTIVAKTRPRNYIKDVILRANAWPGYEPVTGQLEEGFKIEFHPLLSLDGGIIDAILKCEIDHVEKLVPVNIDVSNAVTRQQQRIEVPQAVAAHLHERFRWPADQVLLISLGVVPTPVPTTPSALGMKVPLLSPASRADLLVFVESKGKLGAQPTALQPAGRPASTYQNRYYRGASDVSLPAGSARQSQ